MPGRPSARALGPRAEQRVRLYYRLRGYRVLAKNARAGRNELDIVLRRGRRLVFCEVKARSGDGYGDPREAVGPEKVRRLRWAAEIWLARNPDLLELEVAFEVVGVRGKRIERVPL
jgi:putative endonuclease